MRRVFFLYCALVSSFSFSGQIKNFDEYKEARKELISEVKELSGAHAIVLSEEEEKVNTYLTSLLTKECKKQRFLPALNFLACQKDIETSSLYSLLQHMPKGALLHVHPAALGDLRWLVTAATYRSDCYIYIGKKKEKLNPGCVRIFATPPNEDWEPISVARRRSGNSTQFDQKLYESFIVQVSDLSQPHVWERFQNCFYNFMGLFSDRDVYKTFIKRALLQLIQEDNVQYLEVREAPEEEVVVMYREIVAEIQKNFPFFSLRIICYSNRKKEGAKMIESAQETLRLKKKYPEIIAGFDLTGEEDPGHSTLYFAEDLLSIERMAQQEKMQLPYYFHGGETNWPFGTNLESPEGGISNDNLYDVLLLKSKRVGHGLSLIKNPLLMERFKQADIAIETCPISNQVLGYVHDLRNHPALTYFSAGLAVTISPDDPGIFGYEGVTPDFWEICVAWELDLRALKQLAINSITKSSLDEDRKVALLKVWREKWDAFIVDVLQNHKE